MSVRIINADVLAGLAELPDESVHCVVTSPPYWGLRDYGTGTWEGGDAACDHAPVAAAIEANFAASSTLGGGKATQMACGQKRGFERECRKCGAIRIDRQIGLEATPEAFVARMVEVFREVRRVVRRDGTCWLNLGDSFGPGKQLQGIPWRVALALQADGWVLRQEIIWHKSNPMPESVTDRPTKAHEQIFLLTKAERYYYDAEAIKEAANYPEGPGNKRQKYTEAYLAGDERHRTKAGLVNIGPSDSRNARSVWTIATAPFAEAHFATFPPELPERCIKAGCPKGGTVLDPFGGAGTTGLVADRLQRNAVMIELNPEYAAMAEKRIANDAGGLFASVDVQKPVEYQLALPEAAE
jgi:DNA modification methylase